MVGLSASTEEKSVIQASEVETIIRAGEQAKFDNCIISGNLNLSELTIKRPVNFNNTIFSLSVNFADTKFEGFASFRGAVFKNDTNFTDSQFFGCVKYETKYVDIFGNISADFSDAEFNGKADFSSSEFKCDVFFRDGKFNDMADFGDAEFNGSTYFTNAEFNGDAYFWNNEFNQKATFYMAVFNGTANFGSRKFNFADFTNAKFNDYAIFREASLSDACFIGAQFDKEAHFEGATFAGTFTVGTSFQDAWFKDIAFFNDAVFENELELTRTRYSKLFIRWSSIQGSLAYDDTAYISLMKNFKDLGYYEDYDSCYFAYRKAHRDQNWSAVSGWEQVMRKTIDYPLEWFYGYGTKPLNAFLWSLGIVITFFIYWWWLGLGGPKDKTKESLNEGEEWLDGDLTDILGFSVTVFLSGTKFFIDPPALPKIEGRSRSWIKKAFILERVLGALFSVLFFIAISGTIVRAA